MFLTKELFFNESEQNVSDFFSLYKEDILKIFSKLWKEEDRIEESDKIYNLNQYLYVYLYCMLIKNEYLLGVNTDWNYYITKYKINEKRKLFACNGISLDNVLKVFSLPVINNGFGIENLGVENSFTIEPTDNLTNTIIKIDVNYLLSYPNNILLYLNTECRINDADIIETTLEDVLEINNENLLLI
jgi:hypothetical protein